MSNLLADNINDDISKRLLSVRKKYYLEQKVEKKKKLLEMSWKDRVIRKIKKVISYFKDVFVMIYRHDSDYTYNEKLYELYVNEINRYYKNNTYSVNQLNIRRYYNKKLIDRKKNVLLPIILSIIATVVYTLITYYIKDMYQKLSTPLYKMLLVMSNVFDINMMEETINASISIDFVFAVCLHFIIIAVILAFNYLFFILIWKLINIIASLASGRLDLTMDFAYEYENEYIKRMIEEKMDIDAKIDGKIKGNDLKKVNDKKLLLLICTMLGYVLGKKLIDKK